MIYIIKWYNNKFNNRSLKSFNDIYTLLPFLNKWIKFLYIRIYVWEKYKMRRIIHFKPEGGIQTENLRKNQKKLDFANNLNLMDNNYI